LNKDTSEATLSIWACTKSSSYRNWRLPSCKISTTALLSKPRPLEILVRQAECILHYQLSENNLPMLNRRNDRWNMNSINHAYKIFNSSIWIVLTSALGFKVIAT
jgi:hypothetical protein